MMLRGSPRCAQIGAAGDAGLPAGGHGRAARLDAVMLRPITMPTPWRGCRRMGGSTRSASGGAGTSTEAGWRRRVGAAVPHGAGCRCAAAIPRAGFRACTMLRPYPHGGEFARLFPTSPRNFRPGDQRPGFFQGRCHRGAARAVGGADQRPRYGDRRPVKVLRRHRAMTAPRQDLPPRIGRCAGGFIAGLWRGFGPSTPARGLAAWKCARSSDRADCRTCLRNCRRCSGRSGYKANGGAVRWTTPDPVLPGALKGCND